MFGPIKTGHGKDPPPPHTPTHALKRLYALNTHARKHGLLKTSAGIFYDLITVDTKVLRS